MTNEELQGELIASLHETMETLSLVVFLSIKNHPDQDAVDKIEAVLVRAKTALKIAENEERKKHE